MAEPAPEPAATGDVGGEALVRTNTGALSRTASALASALDISAEDVSKVRAAMPSYSIQHLHRTLETFALEAGGDGTIGKSAFMSKLAETAGEENPALLAFSASMFEVFDTDSSGSIDSVEYHLSLATLCRGSSAAKNGFIFECLDKDKSGSISFEQFFSFFKSTLAAVGRVNLAKKMGLSEDNPLYTVFAMQQIEAEKTEAEQVFAAIDQDSDMLISREEFLAALAKPAALGSPHLKAVVGLLKMFTDDDADEAVEDAAPPAEEGVPPEPEPEEDGAALLSKFVAVCGNQFCADCGRPDPSWASSNTGALICLHCSGVHRLIGTDNSAPLSVKLDDWDEGCIAVMMQNGNTAVNARLEATLDPALKPTPESGRADVENFIWSKYALKAFAEGGSNEIVPLPVERGGGEKSASTIGTIVYAGMLQLTVLSGSGLKSKDAIGKSDPYIVARIGDAPQQAATKVIDNSHTPEWNEMLMLNVPSLEDALYIECFDHDSDTGPKTTKAGREGDDMLGVGFVCVHQLIKNPGQQMEIEIDDPTAKKTKDKAGGSIKISATYMPLDQ